MTAPRASASRRTTRASPRASMRDVGGVPREWHPVRLSSALRVWLMLLGPAMDLTHNPKARRGWESFGPDPYLTGEGVFATVTGIQSVGVQAALVDDRTMHEMYWYPFLRSIEANVSAIMCAYNQLNGASSCHNAGLLGPTSLVRAVGFQVRYVSDWGATHVADNANAGLDMEQPGDWILIGASPLPPRMCMGQRIRHRGRQPSGDVSTAVSPFARARARRIDQMAARVLAPYYWLGQESVRLPPSTSNITGIVYADAPGVQTGRGADGPHDPFMRCAGPATQWGAGLADAMCGMRDEAAYGTTIVYNSLGFPVVRLPTSRPAQVNYTEQLLLDYRYMDAQGITPHYEFGFGLSYTAFTYSAPKIVSTGSGATSQVVMYLAYLAGPGMLRGFDEVVLAAGASAVVSMTIAPREMRVVRPRDVTVTVGASIKDVRLTGTF
ncbi:glycoside hydrolase superfamily [Mycena sp. CBHHK59/15]|nr:glycoside hydrolase superfamily [Mycena sp. CBHHK59/15]